MKKKLTEEDVKNVAKLANLTLTAKEVEKFKSQLEETIEYIDHLAEVDTSNILPTSQVTGLENIYREDEMELSFPQSEALSQAKQTEKGFFIKK